MDVDYIGTPQSQTLPGSKILHRPRCIEIAAGHRCVLRATLWPYRVRLETALGLAIDMLPSSDTAADILTTHPVRTSSCVVDFSAELVSILCVRAGGMLIFDRNSVWTETVPMHHTSIAWRTLTLQLYEGSAVHNLPRLRPNLQVNYCGNVSVVGCTTSKPQFASVRLREIPGAAVLQSSLNLVAVEIETASGRMSADGSATIPAVPPQYRGRSGAELLLCLERRLAELAKQLNKLSDVKGFVRHRNTLDALVYSDAVCSDVMSVIRSTQGDTVCALVDAKIAAAHTKVHGDMSVLADDVALPPEQKVYDNCSVCMDSQAPVMGMCGTCNTAACEPCLDELILVHGWSTCLTCKQPMTRARVRIVNG